MFAKYRVPDQTPHYAAPDLDLHNLPMDRSISNFKDVHVR